MKQIVFLVSDSATFFQFYLCIGKERNTSFQEKEKGQTYSKYLKILSKSWDFKMPFPVNFVIVKPGFRNLTLKFSKQGQTIRNFERSRAINNIAIAHQYKPHASFIWTSVTTTTPQCILETGKPLGIVLKQCQPLKEPLWLFQNSWRSLWHCRECLPCFHDLTRTEEGWKVQSHSSF